MAKTYPRCKCGKLSRVIFFHAGLNQYVDWCWECFDEANHGNVGHGSA
jgi:hypothetical protein